jgi:hypothetical protein
MFDLLGETAAAHGAVSSQRVRNRQSVAFLWMFDRAHAPKRYCPVFGEGLPVEAFYFALLFFAAHGPIIACFPALENFRGSPNVNNIRASRHKPKLKKGATARNGTPAHSSISHDPYSAKFGHPLT